MLSEIVRVDFRTSRSLPNLPDYNRYALTYSIATGLGLGFIGYTVVKLFSGRWKDIHWMMYIIAIRN